ncbi:MAG: L-serine ammonia-lyase, iron-sulfur-dependent subunit beta [Cellulosilyticaceae bacterium]
MKAISVFDVIGPNMIGPSSSHTAGALRIALLVRKLVPEPIKLVKFILYGSFAKTYRGHGTDRALVAGMLGMSTEDERIKDAFMYAKKAGLNYSFEINEEKNDFHPNTVEIIVTDEDCNITSVIGSSIGGGNISIDEINGMEVHFTGEYSTILVRQKDTPGVVAHITKCLSNYKINIAFMRLYRESKGEIAYTIIEADEAIDDGVIAKIKENHSIESVRIIESM